MCLRQKRQSTYYGNIIPADLGHRNHFYAGMTSDNIYTVNFRTENLAKSVQAVEITQEDRCITF